MTMTNTFGIGALVALSLCAACEPPASAPAPVEAGAPDGGSADLVALPPPPTGASTSPFQTIDDFETGQANIVSPVGLASWSVTALGSPPLEGGGHDAVLATPPADGPAGFHAWSIRVAEQQAVDLRIDIHGPRFHLAGEAEHPDLSAYAGVAFWARAPTATSVTVAIQDASNASRRSYEDARANGDGWFEHPVQVETTWRRHILLFDDFASNVQANNALNRYAISSLHFLVGLARSGAHVWIDDLALLCRGTCPTPPLEDEEERTPREDDIQWRTDSDEDPRFACGQIATLDGVDLQHVPKDARQKLFLRARIPQQDNANLPLWAWTVENTATGEKVPTTPIDEANATVAVPVGVAGTYRVRAHTHHPGTNVCGASVTLRVR